MNHSEHLYTIFNNTFIFNFLRKIKYGKFEPIAHQYDYFSDCINYIIHNDIMVNYIKTYESNSTIIFNSKH